MLKMGTFRLVSSVQVPAPATPLLGRTAFDPTY